MRVRSDAKRNEILGAAREAFQDKGYERATMSDVAARFGGSKATLYGYFRSKEDLMLAVVQQDVAVDSGALVDLVTGASDLRTGLIHCGVGYMQRALGPRATATRRMIGGQPESSGLGLKFYDEAIKPAWLKLCAHLETVMGEGVLRRADPWTTTMHFKGLIDGELLELQGLNALPSIDADRIARTVEAGVDAFLRAYAPETSTKLAAE